MSFKNNSIKLVINELLIQGVLMEETLYVSHCIQKILSLYKISVENVILIGHSMVSTIIM